MWKLLRGDGRARPIAVVAKGKKEKNRIIAYFKDQCTLFKISKMNTSQDKTWVVCCPSASRQVHGIIAVTVLGSNAKYSVLVVE